MAQARTSLEALKEIDNFNNRSDERKLPFLLDNYEVIISSFHFSWCITTQVKGGLNNLLSTRWKLPNFIYVLFSNDQVDDSETLGGEIYKVLDDLFTFISRSILERKLELPKKARRFKPPSVVVVKTVAKSTENLEIDDFKLKRRTLNRAIQKEAANRQWRSINIDSILPGQRENFTDNGEDLSDEGFRKYWSFISEDLKSTVHPKENRHPKNNRMHKDVFQNSTSHGHNSL